MIKTSRGRVGTAIKALVYGVHGIGKTTFASKWPNPLFIDVEGSSEQLDNNNIVRYEPTPTTFRAFLSVIDELQTAGTEEFKTIVIDTSDWLEGMIINQICQDEKITCIEKYGGGYGKGWAKVEKTWRDLLDKLDLLRRSRGVNILFIAHSQIKKFEPVDDVAYDRYVLRQKEKTGPILFNWSDLVLFCRYDVMVIENEAGKAKAVSNAKKVMHTVYSPCWDAKNRFGLPEKLPFDFKSIEHIFRPPVPEPPVKNFVVDPSSPLVPPATVSIDSEVAELLRQLEELMNIDGVTCGELTAMVEEKGIVPAGTELKHYNKQTLTRIISGWSAVKNNIEIRRKQK